MKGNILTEHTRFKIGRIVFYDCVVSWKRVPVEDNIVDEEEAANFCDFLHEIGIPCQVRLEKPGPRIVLNYEGRPIYGYAVLAERMEPLDGATEEELERIRG